MLSKIFYKFLDVDECNEGSHNCHKNAQCADLIGSFNCSCKTGFSGDGIHCQGKFFFKIGNTVGVRNHRLSFSRDNQ